MAEVREAPTAEVGAYAGATAAAEKHYYCRCCYSGTDLPPETEARADGSRRTAAGVEGLVERRADGRENSPYSPRAGYHTEHAAGPENLAQEPVAAVVDMTAAGMAGDCQLKRTADDEERAGQRRERSEVAVVRGKR